MADDVSEQCFKGLLPKLPFLLEERDETSLVAFFTNPCATSGGTGEKDAVAFPLPTTERVKTLSNLVNKLESEGGFQWWTQLSTKARANVLLFLSEYSSEKQLWSNPECYGLFEKICMQIEQGVKGEAQTQLHHKHHAPPGLHKWFLWNCNESLTPRETDIFAVLQSVKSKLDKSNWKHFPACAFGLGWMVKQIPGPVLTSTILDMIIPRALLFTDDYFDDFKILGLETLSYIVNNSGKNELIRNNWAVVIYDAVERLCFDKNPTVIQLVIPLLLKILQYIEKDPADTTEFTKYDHLLKQILFEMEFRADVHQKQVWLPILDDILQTMGVATLHWSDRICGMLKDFTICNDHIVWINILQVITTVIKNTWFQTDCEAITEVVLRVLLNASTFHGVNLNAEDKRRIHEISRYCFELLQKCDGFQSTKAQINEIINNGESILLHPSYILTLKEIISNEIK